MGHEDADTVVIGKGIRIKGTVKGAEDLELQGQVEGAVALPAHGLTVAASARMLGDVKAQQVTLQGDLAGTATVTGCAVLDAGARVLGDLKTTRLVIADGARMAGRVKMDVDLPPELAKRQGRATKEST